MGCKVGSSETRRGLRREEKGVRSWRGKKRDDCVSGTHTGVGLDSFIGRAAHRGERGREEGSGIGERGVGGVVRDGRRRTMKKRTKGTRAWRNSRDQWEK